MSPQELQEQAQELGIFDELLEALAFWEELEPKE